MGEMTDQQASDVVEQIHHLLALHHRNSGSIFLLLSSDKAAPSREGIDAEMAAEIALNLVELLAIKSPEMRSAWDHLRAIVLKQRGIRRQDAGLRQLQVMGSHNHWNQDVR